MEDKRNIISGPMISKSFLVRDIRSVRHPVKAVGVSDILDKFSPDAMVGFLQTAWKPTMPDQLGQPRCRLFAAAVPSRFVCRILHSPPRAYTVASAKVRSRALPGLRMQAAEMEAIHETDDETSRRTPNEAFDHVVGAADSWVRGRKY
jgi:hypothetical protein